MNAAALQSSASVPVAATPPSAPQGGAGGGGGITPASGQGFVPASGAEASQAGAASAPQSAEKMLASITALLGDEFLAPIVAADGTVYAERRKPTTNGGKVALSYVVIGKIDPATKQFAPSEAIKAIAQEKAKEESGAKRVLVKVGDQMVWQTFSKDESGKTVVTDVAPASEQEVAAYQQQQQAAAAQQAGQQKLQGAADWQQKAQTVAQHLGIFGSAGQFVSALSTGPNAMTGKPGGSWIQGYILATRLNGKAENKLLPSWVSSGPVASALEWGIQAWGMLDMGNDVRVLRDYFAGRSLPAVNPNAVAQLQAAGHHPAMAQALTQLGTELRDGTASKAATLQLVDGTANAALLNTKLGAAQLVQKSDLHAAVAATDPIQSAGLKVKGNIDSGIHKGIGALKGLVQPAMIGATALGWVAAAIGMKNTLETKGAAHLLNTQQGRGQALGLATNTAFLGMYLLPMALGALKVASPAVAAVSSAVNIAQNVIGGVQLLNSYGLFGGDNAKGGFLDNDAVRAAFLIPPLTPLGAFAFWMKSRKKAQAAEAAKLEAAQKLAVERITQQREMAKLQLQSTGQVAGAVQGPDGTMMVPTTVPNDLTQLAAQIGGTAAPAGAAAAPSAAATAAPAAGASGDNAALAEQRRQLTMTARPMR